METKTLLLFGCIFSLAQAFLIILVTPIKANISIEYLIYAVMIIFASIVNYQGAIRIAKWFTGEG